MFNMNLIDLISSFLAVCLRYIFAPCLWFVAEFCDREIVMSKPASTPSDFRYGTDSLRPVVVKPVVVPSTIPTVLRDIDACIKKLQGFKSRLTQWQKDNLKRSLDEEVVTMASVRKQLDHAELDIVYMEGKFNDG